LVAINDERTEAQALKRIGEIQAKLAKGALFQDLAKEFSDDPGSAVKGGDLGLNAKGTFVPEFEKAQASLVKGKISEPVKTNFGYHLIQLLDTQEPPKPSLESLTAVLSDRIIQEKAKKAFNEAIDQMKDLAFSSADLQLVSDALNLPIQTLDWITRVRGTAYFQDAKWREIAFSEEVKQEGLNSDVLMVAENEAWVIRKKNYRPKQTIPLAQIKDRVKADFIQDKSIELIKRKIADWNKSHLKSDKKITFAEALPSIQKTFGTQYSWNAATAARGVDNLPQALSAGLFKIAENATWPQVHLVQAEKNEQSEDLYLVFIESIHVPELTESDRMGFKSVLGFHQAQMMQAYFAKDLEQSTEIEFKDALDDPREQNKVINL
jgi:peptidyl-prolyl cis-trans isomerase D